ncbi:MAG: hypothetical protein AAB296_04090, partial [Candidatus Desantisbacteria bacterium]
SEKERKKYEGYLMNLARENDIMEGAREEGITEGRAEGMAEGRTEEREKIVKNMIKLGMPIEDIAQIIGLTISEAGELKEKRQ